MSQAVVLIGHSVSSNSLNSTNELNSLETELCLIRYKLGTDKNLTDFPLRSAWEGIRFAHHLIQDVALRTVPLLQRKDTAVNFSQVKSLIASSLSSITPSDRQLQTRIEELEQGYVPRFVKHDKLFVLFSGGDKHPAGQALLSHLRHLVARIETLEPQGNGNGGLGLIVVPSLPSSTTSQYDPLAASIVLIKRDITFVSHCIGQEVVHVGGEFLNLCHRLSLMFDVSSY